MSYNAGSGRFTVQACRQEENMQRNIEKGLDTLKTLGFSSGQTA